jgi:teichuronic acid biosynthesis glycosyltransferase TuaG
MTHTVSIIMPCFNADVHIAQAIKSVQSQSYHDWELLICDDGSTDNSFNTISNFAKNDKRIIILKNDKPKGAAIARNNCILKASGRYIAFLDADDLWFKKKLELQVNFMKKNNYLFVYSYHNTIREDGSMISKCMAPSSVNSSLMKFSNFIPCLTAIYDAKNIGKVYQPKIKKRNDLALWFKILNLKIVPRAYCLPISTGCYRVNSYGLSSNKLDALKYFYKCLVDHGKCNIIEALIYTLFYSSIVIVKKYFTPIYNFLINKI